MSLPVTMSVIFLLASAVYFFYGILVLSYNGSSTQHRVLFCSFLCLSWWAFAFSIANSAPDFETTLLWRRLASVGWGIYYSLLLHYILILTEKNTLLQKYWLYLLIYMPATLNVFLYGIYDRTVHASYHLLKTPLGWVNVAGVKTLDIPHLASYLVFTLASVIFLFHWGITSQKRTKRKIALIIGGSTFFALIIGTLTEHLINAFFQVDFPQIGPIVILIPALAMFYCIRRYGLMQQISKVMSTEKNQMLSDYAQARLFLYLALASLLGSYIGFATLYFANLASLTISLYFGAVLMLAGIIIFVTRTLNLKADLKDTIIGLVLAITLLALTLIIYEFTKSHSWNVTIIFVMVAIIFSDKKIIFLTGISLLLSLLWSWVKAPVNPIMFAEVDHVVRIIVMAIMFGYVYSVNRIFRQAITENQKKAGREELLSEIAATLMSVDENNIDVKLKTVMTKWSSHLQAKCVKIFFLADAQTTVKKTYQLCDGEISSAVTFSATEQEEIFAAAISLSREVSGSLEINTLTGGEAESQWAEKIKTGLLSVIPLKNANQLIGIATIEKTVSKPGLEEEQQITSAILARMVTDVWLKIEGDKKIKHEAYYDSLTGLPNRLHFTDRLRQATDEALQTDKLIGVLFVDIDSFKSVNDALGHLGGDLFLQQVGQRLRENVREDDEVARFGADEFLIMLTQAKNLAEIENMVTLVLEGLKKPIMLREQKFFISVNIGVAVCPIDGYEPDDLLKNANIAMYVSKEIGKNRYALCSAAMKEDAQVSVTLTNDLYLALERNELFLHYQPQYNARTEEITGAEALLRWRHPRLGMISPAIFIPLAEKSGQISNIGAWTISQSCRQNKKWQATGLKPITIAVNLSLAQFMDANLATIVKNALAESGLEPKFLELEITESIAAHDSQNIALTMDRLKTLGVKITIDDFGSGYSSFDRFRDIAVDKLKIDMRFVHGIETNKKDREIIKVILQLGKAFGIKVVAEGVEKERQLLFLRENSCDEIQGYYFHKPMSAGKLGEILLEQTGKLCAKERF
ncbi:MAG: EAL domain-containing protein [Clostridium sp.]|nr:EAL domain-containing protein [Clostridium sp.]